VRRSIAASRFVQADGDVRCTFKIDHPFFDEPVFADLMPSGPDGVFTLDWSP